MNLKNKLYLILVGVLLLVGGVQTFRLNHALTHTSEIELQFAHEKQLDSVTSARLAISEANKDSLQFALTAAHELNGKLVAGLRIHLAPRDTIIVHDTLTTTLASDSTRTAKFADSTFAGRVEGTVTAPPCCAPLSISYAVHRPEFNPEIGFVRVGNSYVATVSWQGERAQASAPFFTPLPKKLSWLGYFAGGYINQDKTVYGRGGVELRTPLANGQAGLDTRGEFFAGLTKSW